MTSTGENRRVTFTSSAWSHPGPKITPWQTAERARHVGFYPGLIEVPESVSLAISACLLEKGVLPFGSCHSSPPVQGHQWGGQQSDRRYLQYQHLYLYLCLCLHLYCICIAEVVSSQTRCIYNPKLKHIINTFSLSARGDPCGREQPGHWWMPSWTFWREGLPSCCCWIWWKEPGKTVIRFWTRHSLCQIFGPEKMKTTS